MSGVGQEVEPIIDLDFDAHMAAVEKAAPAEEVKAELEPVTGDVISDEPPPVEKPKAEAKPVAVAKPEEEITDPDTGDKIDLRTREGKRIQRLLERTKRAESETARLRSAVPATPITKPIEETKVEPLAEPKPENFTGPTAVDDYIKARVTYGVEQALAADRAAQQKDQAQREATERARVIHTREAAFVKEHPDYYDVLGTSKLIEEISDGVMIHKSPTASAIQDALHSENGPALAYLLGTNRELHTRVATLSPVQALLVLGQHLQSEPKLPAKEAPKEEKRSAAPPPPEVVEGRASAADPNPMERDFDTHVVIGNREDAAKSRSARRRSAA